MPKTMKRSNRDLNRNVLLAIPSYSPDDSGFQSPIGETYDYWEKIISYFLTKADTVEIHCWKDEKASMNELSHFEEKAAADDGDLIIFTVKKTPALSEFLVKSHLKNGRMKWFTVNLILRGETVLHSGHWGTELAVYGLSEEDLSFITNTVPSETDFTWW